MSRLAEFRRLEQKLAAQLAELEALKNDEGLKKEVEFEQKLRALFGQYGCSLRDVIDILDPKSSRRVPSAVSPAASQRKARQVKIYKNPHNGETVETKGGNHKLLKQWKQEHGVEEVESWLAR